MQPGLPQSQAPTRPGRQGEEKGSRNLERPAREARLSSRPSWSSGRESREGAVHSGTAVWPCPRATGRPPQLPLSSPSGDQTADKAALSFPVRQAISSPIPGLGGGGGYPGCRDFTEGVGGAPLRVTLRRSASHAHFWFCESHVECPCPSSACFPRRLGCGGGTMLDPKELIGSRKAMIPSGIGFNQNAPSPPPVPF